MKLENIYQYTKNEKFSRLQLLSYLKLFRNITKNINEKKKEQKENNKNPHWFREYYIKVK